MCYISQNIKDLIELYSQVQSKKCQCKDCINGLPQYNISFHSLGTLLSPQSD